MFDAPFYQEECITCLGCRIGSFGQYAEAIMCGCACLALALLRLGFAWLSWSSFSSPIWLGLCLLSQIQSVLLLLAAWVVACTTCSTS